MFKHKIKQNVTEENYFAQIRSVLIHVNKPSGGWIGVGRSVDPSKPRPKSADPQLFAVKSSSVKLSSKNNNPQSVSKIIQNP